MCVIIVKPVNVNVTKRQIKNCWSSNPDGAGFMYTAHGRLMVTKGFFTYRTLYSAFRTAERAFPDSPFVLHFRVATSGEKDRENCHPFYVNEDVGVAHNGVFYEWTDVKSLYSDTNLFTQNVLKKLPKDFIYNEGINTLLENYCSGSKLVFMNAKGDVSIIKEYMGAWHQGLWFSNASYEPDKKFGFKKHCKLDDEYGEYHYNYARHYM